MYLCKLQNLFNGQSTVPGRFRVPFPLAAILLSVLMTTGSAMGHNFDLARLELAAQCIGLAIDIESYLQELREWRNDNLSDDYVRTHGFGAAMLRKDVDDTISSLQLSGDALLMQQNNISIRSRTDFDRWANWLIGHADKFDQASDRVKEYNDRYSSIQIQYGKDNQWVLQYMEMAHARIEEISAYTHMLNRDSTLAEITFRIDAGIAVAETYNQHVESLKGLAESWAELSKRIATEFHSNGPSAAINYLLNHFGYIGPRPPADAAHRFLEQKLGTRQTFAPPDISNALARYRKAHAIIVFLRDQQVLIDAFQAPIPPNHVAFANMRRIANYDGVPQSEILLLDQFAQANADYAEGVRSLPDIGKYVDPDHDWIIADRLIAAEAELRNAYSMLARMHQEVTGARFQTARALRARWMGAYLRSLLSEAESRVARLQAFENGLLQGNLSHGLPDSEALLSTLSMNMKGERTVLTELQATMDQERTRNIGTMTAWAGALENIPLPTDADGRLEGLVQMLIDFSALDSIDPDLYLERCELALTLFPGHAPIRHEKAVQLNRLGRYAEAEAILLDLYTAEPTRQDMAVSLASSYEGQGNTDAAEALFRDMLADTPSDELYTVEAWLRFAHRQGELTEATQGLESVFEARDKLEEYHRMLLAVYSYVGYWLAATPIFESMPRDTRTTEFWKHYVRLGLSAEDTYTRALRAAAEDTDASYYQIVMAEARLKQGRIEEARELLEAAGLEHTPWSLLSAWIDMAEISGEQALIEQVSAAIDRINGEEERNLMRAYRMIARGEYREAAVLLAPYEWPRYPYTRYLRARAAAGLEDWDTALAILEKLDRDEGYDLAAAIPLKFQIQVFMGHRAQASETLGRIAGTRSPDCPILLFHECLYEARFGSRKEAMRLKSDVLAAYPMGLPNVSMVCNILPESLARFDRAGHMSQPLGAAAVTAVLLAVFTTMFLWKRNKHNNAIRR